MQAKYLKSELVLIVASIAMATLGFLFTFTPGLMDDSGRYTHRYMSTGSDDDLSVTAAIPLFGLCALLTFRFSARLPTAAIKVIGFSVTWLCQLLALHWIEVGSLFTTVVHGENQVLAAFLIVFSVALPMAWLALIHDWKVGARAREQIGKPVEIRPC